MPIYISIILTQVHPDKSLTKETNNAIHLYMEQLVKKIVCSNDDLKTSMKKVIGDNEVLKYAIREGNKGSKVVSPATIRKMIDACRKVEEKDIVFLTGVVDYLIAEILELSGNIATGHKRMRINMMDVDYAIRNDEDMMHAYKLLPHNALVEWKPPLPTEKNSLTEIRYALGKHKIIPMTQQLIFPTKYVMISKKKDLLALMTTQQKKKDCNPNAPIYKANPDAFRCNTKTGRWNKIK
jgi:histone H3/H4